MCIQFNFFCTIEVTYQENKSGFSSAVIGLEMNTLKRDVLQLVEKRKEYKYKIMFLKK